MTEKTLHACRIAAKQSRYLAELATDSIQARAFVEELKHAQDEVGEWHDVMRLQQRAAKLFGTVHDSALVAALGGDGQKLVDIGRSVKQAAYDVQHQAWSKTEVSGRDSRLFLASKTIRPCGT